MSNHWSSASKSEVGELLFSTFEYLKEQNGDRIALQQSHMALYDNILDDYHFDTEISRAARTIRVPVAYNLCQSLVETVTSRVGATKPGVKLLSTNADWSLRSETKKLNDFLFADWRRMQLQQEVRAVIKDALVYNIGVLKFYTEDNRTHCERVEPTTILVDNFDGKYGKPRQYLQYKHVSKDALKNLFPGHESVIEDLPTISYLNGESGFVTDMVEVVEGWYLPSGKGRPDGRHTITVAGHVLLDDESYDNYLGPFVFYRWINKLNGFWGMSLVEQIKGIQIEINKIALHIQRAVHLASKPYLVAMATSGVKPEIMDNDRNRLSMIFYKPGTAPPRLENPSAINPELLRYLDYLWNKGFEVTGVSQAHATARKPGGLNSGVALREYADITSERFLNAEMALQELYVRCAEQTIYHATKIATNTDYDVTVIANDVYTTIKWGNINLAADQYVIQPMPVSVLPKTWAGKVQTVNEMQAAGIITPEAATELLDLPDLERYKSLTNAGRNLVRKIVEQIIDESIYTQPDPMMDLNFGMKHAVQVYNLGRVEGNIPEENLELLAQWIAEVSLLQEQEAAKQAPAPQQGGQPPQQ